MAIFHSLMLKKLLLSLQEYCIINETRVQRKECRAKMLKKYASLRNTKGFDKELDWKDLKLLRSRQYHHREVPRNVGNS